MSSPVTAIPAPTAGAIFCFPFLLILLFPVVAVPVRFLFAFGAAVTSTRMLTSAVPAITSMMMMTFVLLFMLLVLLSACVLLLLRVCSRTPAGSAKTKTITCLKLFDFACNSRLCRRRRWQQSHQCLVIRFRLRAGGADIQNDVLIWTDLLEVSTLREHDMITACWS